MELDFAARYLLMPNKLKYEKLDSSDQQLFNFCCGSGNEKEIKSLLKEYHAINMFLELIAKKNNKKPFDKEVLEAYWLGNDLLKNISSDDVKTHLKDSLEKNKAEPELIKELIPAVPENIHPHHTFHILHIHSITKDKNFIYSNFNKGKVNYGKVIEINKDSLTIEKNNKRKQIHYDDKFISNYKVGDLISFKWDFALDVITKKQAEQLDHYTEKHRKIMEFS